MAFGHRPGWSAETLRARALGLSEVEPAVGKSVLTGWLWVQLLTSLSPFCSRTLYKPPVSFQQLQISLSSVLLVSKQKLGLTPLAQGSLLSILSHQGAGVLGQEATL